MDRRTFVFSGLSLTLPGVLASAAEQNGTTGRPQGIMQLPESSLGVPAQVANPSTRPVKGLIEIRDDEYPVPLAHAVNRLRAYSPIALDMSCSADPRVHPELYSFTLLVGVTGNDPDLQKAWSGNPPASEDAWALKTLLKSPTTIAVTGKRPRGVLYAAYRVADYMKLGRDLSTLDEMHEPRVPEREGFVNAVAFGSERISRNSQYMSTLNELPRYGLNSVFIVPGRSLPADHETLPISVDENGKFRVDESRRLRWMPFLDAVKSYDMNVTISADPLVPPGFEKSQVNAFVRTGKIPAKYLESLRVFYEDFINKLLDALPQVDTIALTPGVEGAMYPQNGSLRIVRLFLAGQDLQACSTIMAAYFDVVTQIAKTRGKCVVFRIHSWGATSDGYRAMWDVPLRYPGVVRLADDYVPNEAWPDGGTRLPIMAYLPPDVRARFDQGAPLGALSVTDAECDGDGALPNAIADQYIYSAKELIKHKCVWVTFRLNAFDWTPWGTLWNVSGIEIEQFANAIWTNARSPQRVWDEWIERQWGKAAAPFVSAALAKSGVIVQNGLLIDGITMFHHSTIGPIRWTPSKQYSYNSSSFQMFRRPGTLLYTKGPNASRTSDEQEPAELHTRAISIEEFRRRQARAVEAADEASAELDKATPFLSRPDDVYLHSIFSNARLVIRIFSALGEMAYAANLLADNYAGVANPRALFEKAAADVEQLANDSAFVGEFSYAFAYHGSRDTSLSNDAMKNVLFQMVAMYRDYAKSH